jgi:hypothetical protein
MPGGRPRKFLEIGSRFGFWTVIGPPESSLVYTRQLCRCDCGIECMVAVYSIRRGDSSRCESCRSRTHGESFRSGQSSEYRAWAQMRSRCKPEHKNHDRYYDRGIRVCDEWVGPGSFEKFLAHIGRRPSAGHTLDRIDGDRGYEPGNVRWVTWTDQQRNKASNRMVTIDGETRCVAAWSEISGVHVATISTRLDRGIEPRSAVFDLPEDQRRMLRIGRDVKTLAEWARESSVSRVTIEARLRRGWDPRRAIFESVRKKH